LRNFSRFIFWFTGWKVADKAPEGIDKAVLLVAPHTSNWDYVMGQLYAFITKIPVRFLIKKELYFWPLGPIFNKLGGVPVDRKKGRNTVDLVAGLFNEYDKIYIAVTPEGTRKLVKDWRKGFYYIADKAKVPILLSFIDYKRRIVGMGKPFKTSGDIDADMEKIKEFYKDKNARHPEKFNLSVENRDK